MHLDFNSHKDKIDSVQLFECLTVGKDGTSAPSGDNYVLTDKYIAVIDGATPKGEKLWDGQSGDVFVSRLVADAIEKMDPDYTAPEGIRYVNSAVRAAYDKQELDFSDLTPAERLQCSVLIYSVTRKEIWCFGDCMFKINDQTIQNSKAIDKLLSMLRAYCIQIERDRRGSVADEMELSIYGREQILPYLRTAITLANRDVPFGYDVIDGGNINPDNVKVYPVHSNDFVILSTDGYPKLLDTLEETESFLAKALQEDPTCLGILQGTKGVMPGNQSYDDRTYISFRVK